MSEGIPSPSIELGVDAERLRASGLPTKIFVLDSAQILQLHEILPEEATITELGRLRFFNVSFNGEILLFATTPIEEMVIDHWKELQKDKRKKPNTDPFVRLGSGRASVNKFTNMRTSEYLIQGFTMSKSNLGDFAVGACADDITFPFAHSRTTPLPPCPSNDYKRNDLRILAFVQVAEAIRRAWPNCEIIFYIRGVRIARRIQDRGLNDVGLAGYTVKLGHQTDWLKNDVDVALGHTPALLRAFPRPADPKQPTTHLRCRDHRCKYADLDLTIAEDEDGKPNGTVNIEVPCVPAESAPLLFKIKEDYVLRIVLDTNFVTRRWRQMVTFMGRLVGKAKVASLNELKEELADGEDEEDAKNRVEEFQKFLKSVPHKSYWKHSTTIPDATMFPAGGEPFKMELEKDRRIRAEMGELLDRLSKEHRGKKVVVLFLTFDAGCRRLMTAVRSPEGVEFIVPRLDNDIKGPGIIDVLYGITIPYVDEFGGLVGHE